MAQNENHASPVTQLGAALTEAKPRVALKSATAITAPNPILRGALELLGALSEDST